MGGQNGGHGGRLGGTSMQGATGAMDSLRGGHQVNSSQQHQQGSQMAFQQPAFQQNSQHQQQQHSQSAAMTSHIQASLTGQQQPAFNAAKQKTPTPIPVIQHSF